jgi:uncharacterized protein YjiS (DUF1127 family)
VAYSLAPEKFRSTPSLKEALLPFLLRLEAWLDARRSHRTLYKWDEHALKDIGLTRTDLERVN